MKNTKPKRPRDMNQLAKMIVDISTGERPNDSPRRKRDEPTEPATVAEDTAPYPEPGKPEKDPAAVALGRRGGQKGGPARAARMTPEERSESARKAARARWAERDAK